MPDHESRLETSRIRESSPSRESPTDTTLAAALPTSEPGPGPGPRPGNPPPESEDGAEEGPRPLPTAWQPITFRGVASFARARIGRLLAAQFIVALLVAATIVWFLHNTWFARGLEAIRALPATGQIESQILSTPRTSPEPLAADNFIAFAVNVTEAPSLGSASDLRVEFRRDSAMVCSLVGCLPIPYPRGYTILFNQPELEAWWGAWRFTVIAAVIAATTIFLFSSWWALATVYAAPAWIIAYLKDRQVSLLGCWKLASAALLTPALCVAGLVALYGLNAIDLLRLILLWAAHIPLGWVYVHFALRQLPKVPRANETPRQNPFTPPPSQDPESNATPRALARRRPANPFAPPEPENDEPAEAASPREPAPQSPPPGRSSTAPTSSPRQSRSHGPTEPGPGPRPAAPPKAAEDPDDGFNPS